MITTASPRLESMPRAIALPKPFSPVFRTGRKAGMRRQRSWRFARWNPCCRRPPRRFGGTSAGAIRRADARRWRKWRPLRPGRDDYGKQLQRLVRRGSGGFFIGRFFPANRDATQRMRRSLQDMLYGVVDEPPEISFGGGAVHNDPRDVVAPLTSIGLGAVRSERRSHQAVNCARDIELSAPPPDGIEAPAGGRPARICFSSNVGEVGGWKASRSCLPLPPKPI